MIFDPQSTDNETPNTNQTSPNNTRSNNDNLSVDGLIRGHGPAVAAFLHNLVMRQEQSEQAPRTVQEEPINVQNEGQVPNEEPTSNHNHAYYFLSGLPVITGNSILDQLIVLSNGPRFTEVAMGNIIITSGQDQQPTMEDVLAAAFESAQSTRSNPTDRNVVDNLPIISMTKDRLDYKHLINKDDSPQTCNVCIEDYESCEGDLVQLPCEHVFHKDCIIPWITEHNTCPTCRYELPHAESVAEAKRVERMEQRFTKEGLIVMNIAYQDNKMFDKIDSIRTSAEECDD
ncbi:E3 ubiquitin-protein ligase RING1-like, partial [Acrasis kona]